MNTYTAGSVQGAVQTLPQAEYPEGMEAYLSEWDAEYKREIKKIDLFNADKTSAWSLQQKQFFIKVFYHLRGHFAEFLWYMGSFAPDSNTKEMIIRNIRDEFNQNGLSHEQLYFLFAEAFDVDLTFELLDETAYLPFARDYIQGQLRWLRSNDWNHRLAAFAAIERLDNVDYASFRDVATSIGAEKKALTFFNVHICADHFEGVLASAFGELWQKDQALVRNVFSFIKDFQIQMLNQLSNAVFSYS
ncbi:MAG: iron-containing redox enzyme family protein [Coxiellaceae bacterium]|nr:iron-containing redox enzyme family protein [Coxiellaceae bacterium]